MKSFLDRYRAMSYTGRMDGVPDVNVTAFNWGRQVDASDKQLTQAASRVGETQSDTMPSDAMSAILFVAPDFVPIRSMPLREYLIGYIRAIQSVKGASPDVEGLIRRMSTVAVYVPSTGLTDLGKAVFLEMWSLVKGGSVTADTASASVTTTYMSAQEIVDKIKAMNKNPVVAALRDTSGATLTGGAMPAGDGQNYSITDGTNADMALAVPLAPQGGYDESDEGDAGGGGDEASEEESIIDKIGALLGEEEIFEGVSNGVLVIGIASVILLVVMSR